MWYLLMITLMAVFAAGLLYLSFRAARASFVQRLAKGEKGRGRLMCAAAFLALFVLLWALLNLMNALIVFVHLFIIWGICDLVVFVAGKLLCRGPAKVEVPAKVAEGPVDDSGDPQPALTRRNFTGAAAMLLCAAYLTKGWDNDHRVRATRYAFSTPKLTGTVRIAQISDTHLGATFHADRFAEYLEEINTFAPDIFVVTGDFVDDDTSREDMLGACAALARVRATHGVFYVYGNHDKGYYPEAIRGWNNAEMRAALSAAGVTVLEDEAVPLPCGVTVVGRQDRSENAKGTPRATAEALLSDVDRSTYTLMLDHQPADFAAEAAAGADLVLCGHTHGGQLIPLRLIGGTLGINDAWYGHERRRSTDFIVSSGMSNWSLQFKTGCFSEFVIIDLAGTR